MLNTQVCPVQVDRLDVQLNADPTRVLLRRYGMSGPRQCANVVSRVLALSEEEAERCWASTLAEFGSRHRDYQGDVLRRFHDIESLVEGTQLSETRKLLLGASFSMEYSLECAALFNPSIVPHPDQSAVPAGSLRFVLSLRATGEGHVSSITFREGLIDARGQVSLHQGSRHVQAPTLSGDETSGYRASFPPDLPLGEQTLFPITPSQSNGIEDARFVRFEDGTYYGTYTAYDGRNIAPEMVATENFQDYRFLPLRGSKVMNKGMALFPRKVNGLYTMLGREDAENFYLMQSEDLLCWDHSELLATPVFPWEMVQIGNCGSPIETEAGWLVLTHGVGPNRKYSIGVMLLDKDDPARIIGRLPQPILSPTAEEREGYVPNVVYTCGGIVHGEHLVVPYAMSDSASRFARLSLRSLLEALAG